MAAQKGLPPIVLEALRFTGRIGYKALAAGFGSVLEDVDGAAAEVRRRTAKARRRLAEMLVDGDEPEIDYRLDEDEE